MESGRQFLEGWANYLDSYLSGVLETIFGPAVHRTIVGSITWADLGILGCFLLLVLLTHSLIALVVRHKVLRIKANASHPSWHFQLATSFTRPVYLLVWLYGLYFSATLLLPRLVPDEINIESQQVFGKLLDFGVFFAVCLLFLRLTRVVETRLSEWAAKSDSKLDDVLVPLAGKALRVLVPVFAVILMLPVIGLPASYSGPIGKISSLLIIGAISWILVQAVDAMEKYVLGKYDITLADNLRARKVHTQVKVITKTVYFIIGIFTVASALMLFEEVRRVGTSILASAGVIGVIAGFAAQKTIANLFAGFQLAMAQPIRLDDVVIVESEWGRVEEITLTYVVVHIWDDRRLVVPLSYFIEKPFQNWTRVSANLLGSVFLWVDYTLPMGELRRSVQQIVEGCADWDRRFWNLQVTDTSEQAMQIRVLATAGDSGKAWNLRCEIREKLIELIQDKHPDGLPKVRGNLTSPSWQEHLTTLLPKGS